MEAASEAMFTHAMTDLRDRFEKAFTELEQADVHNRPTDYVNERQVDFFKTAVGHFSSMLPETAERCSQALWHCSL
jgi:hypothetical protein